MMNLAKRVRIASVLVFSVLSIGCSKWSKIDNLPATASQQEIKHGDIVVTAATQPDGRPSLISVSDRFKTGGDAVNEIVIGWSQANAGLAEYATISFPVETFGEGPKKVRVTAAHEKGFRLEAFDKEGKFVRSAEHRGAPGAFETLEVKGGRIARIDIIGAEIGIQEIAYSM